MSENLSYTTWVDISINKEKKLNALVKTSFFFNKVHRKRDMTDI